MSRALDPSVIRHWSPACAESAAAPERHEMVGCNAGFIAYHVGF